MEKSLEGKRILILQQRNWAVSIGHFLAKQLHREGCRLAAITLKKSTDAFIRSQTDVPYDLIISNDEVMENPKAHMNGETIGLGEICRDLGVDSIWPIVMTLRNHVRSYKDKFYYSFKQNVSDDEIVDYVKATYLYTKKVFQDFRPDLILTPNFVALPHIILNLYAKNRGIKMFGVTDTKIKGIYMFTYDHCDSRGPFFTRLEELNENRAMSQNAARVQQYIADFRQNFIKPTHFITADKHQTLYKTIRHELSPFRQIWNWYTQPNINHLNNLGITADYRPPRIILRDFYAEKRYRKFMNKFDYYPLKKIEKYVYFPLQFQPEASIDVIAPYFSNQIETARLIAMSLPDDYTLVVKEHPAMVGFRPPSYLEKIARTPNVKLIDYRIPSETILKNADLVISPNSTTLAEAAFYNKSAIQLGNLGTTLALPNVIRHTDVTTLSAAIKTALKRDLHTSEYEKRLENFVAAVYDTGFDVDYINIWEQGDPSGLALERLWRVYRKEIISNLI